MRVLIAGCGDVGTRLGLRLVGRGDVVFGLRRDPSGLPDRFERVAADLADPGPDGFAGLPEAPDAIVYLAAAGARSEDAYERAYLRGPRNLREHYARTGGVPRWIFASSTAVYGQHEGEWVDEDSETAPTAFSGQRLLDGERIVAEAGTATALRLGGIYGPGRTRLVDRVRSGAARIAPGVRYTNRIHVDDAAGVCEALLDLPDPPPRLVGVDDEPAPEAEVLGWLAERLGVPVPPVEAPPPGGRITGANKRCSNRLLRALGIPLAYPSYRDGYRALIDGDGDG